MIPNIHQCEFCHATFVNEKNLEKHSCKFKKRYEFITRKTRGLSMYQLYLTWLKKAGRSIKYVDEHTFIHSTQYNHFYRFSEFAAEMGIPDIMVYIEVMLKKGLQPQHWCRDDVLQYFLEYYDCEINPKKHISKSVDTIMRIAEALECDHSEIFQHLDNNTILVLIKSRKLSPWLLLNSKKFREYLRNNASAKERDYIQKYINPAKWKEILARDPNMLKDIRLILTEFGL